MEGFLVVIIAIAVVLLKEKAKKGAANRSNTTYINGKPVRSQGNYQPNPPQKNQTGNQTKMARRDQNRYHSNSTRQNGSNYAGTSQQPRRTSSQNDILYRAKMNVKENSAASGSKRSRRCSGYDTKRKGCHGADKTGRTADWCGV